MKHTIEFTLPDDSDDLDLALYAPNMALALEDIYQYLRDQVKYTDGKVSVFDVKEEFHRILVERDVKLLE